MRRLPYATGLVALGATLTGCAAAPDGSVATADAPACVATTGSSICRKAGSGNPSNVIAVSGEDIRATTAPITGAQPGTTGN